MGTEGATRVSLGGGGGGGGGPSGCSMCYVVHWLPANAGASETPKHALVRSPASSPHKLGKVGPK